MGPAGWAEAQVLCFPRGLSLSYAVPTRSHTASDFAVPARSPRNA